MGVGEPEKRYAKKTRQPPLLPRLVSLGPSRVVTRVLFAKSGSKRKNISEVVGAVGDSKLHHPMKRERGTRKVSRRTVMSETAAISPNGSNWRGVGAA